jgi:chemotaxis protein methyltransferase CheR
MWRCDACCPTSAHRTNDSATGWEAGVGTKEQRSEGTKKRRNKEAKEQRSEGAKEQCLFSCSLVSCSFTREGNIRLPKPEVLELQLSDDLYLRFRDLLLARTGLHYPERKRADLLHGLNMVMHTGDYASVAALYEAAVEGGPAWDLLLIHLTIGETYFFRNEPQFDALRQHILPEILQRRATTRTLRVWSAGCATGEEPYSLAMTIGELLGNQPPWNTTILATDINPQFLARAREGLYSEWSFRSTPDALRARFWIKEHSRWRLRPEIRNMVTFA